MLGDLFQFGWTLGLSGAVALSVVAAIGYLFGRSQRTEETSGADGHGELQRAMRIACQLETIADDLRQDLARHRNEIDRFKSQLRRADNEDTEAAWRRLRAEADSMVGPTLQLVSQLSSAYDKIRQQSQSLANFTGGRTDPLTGLANSRSLEEQLEVLLRSRSDGGGESTVVVITLDSEANDRATRDSQVRQIGQQLAAGLRGDDFAARYGVDDFVVVLPATTLAGACFFGARLRKSIAEQAGLSISCGLAESMPADTPKSLLARADSAAYSARAAGQGQQYLHTGSAILPDSQPAAASAEATACGEAEREVDEPPAFPFKVVAAELPGPEVAGELFLPTGR